MTFCHNPNMFPALALGGVLYAVGDRLARSGRFTGGWRWFLLFLAALSLVPGVLFILYYAHLFRDSEWYLQFRAINHIEVLAGLAGFAFGWAEHRGKMGVWQRRLVGRRLLLRAGLLFILAPFPKPLLLPVDLSGNLHAMWRDDVCLQSVPGTCGPCATATILRQLGIASSEEELALAMFSCFTGTENWYLVRTVRALGLQATYHSGVKLDSVVAPAILGVTVQGRFGHFIALLDRTDTGMVIADSLRGRLVLSHADFQREYGYTGSAIEIGYYPTTSFADGTIMLCYSTSQDGRFQCRITARSLFDFAPTRRVMATVTESINHTTLFEGRIDWRDSLTDARASWKYIHWEDSAVVAGPGFHGEWRLPLPAALLVPPVVTTNVAERPHDTHAMAFYPTTVLGIRIGKTVRNDIVRRLGPGICTRRLTGLMAALITVRQTERSLSASAPAAMHASLRCRSCVRIQRVCRIAGRLLGHWLRRKFRQLLLFHQA